MYKKILFAGVLAVAGFVTLTAFGAKTLAEQKTEIDTAVKAKLEALRADKTAECDARVEAEAQTRFETAQAAKATEEAAAPVKGGKPIKKKGTAKGPKIDPLPAASKPGPDPKSDEGKANTRMNGGNGKADEEKANTRMNGDKGKAEEDKAKRRMGGGGR
jgi:hypothetical protein